MQLGPLIGVSGPSRRQASYLVLGVAVSMLVGLPISVNEPVCLGGSYVQRRIP